MAEIKGTLHNTSKNQLTLYIKYYSAGGNGCIMCYVAVESFSLTLMMSSGLSKLQL